MRGDLIQLYKIVQGVDNINYADFFEYSPITFTRGDKFKIFIARSSTLFRQNSFILRTATIWNNLLFETKNSDSINGFKNSVDRELNYLMYDYDE